MKTFHLLSRPKITSRKLIFIFLMIFAAYQPVFAMDFFWVTTPATSVTTEGYFLQMSGDINAGDFEKFQSFVRANLEKYKKNRFVHLSSNGGNLVEALKIAGMLRSIYPTISVEDGKCASSCFFLYLSGSTRYVHTPGLLGVHRAYFDSKYFAGLKPETARTQQVGLTKIVNGILDENGVPQYLKDIMNRTPSSDIYWLDDDDVTALGEHPAWYEELLIARCNYGKFLENKRKYLSKSAKDEDINALVDNFAQSFIEYTDCQDKIVAEELTKLSKSFEANKPK